MVRQVLSTRMSEAIDKHRRMIYCAFLRKAMREFATVIEMVEASHDINAGTARMGPGMAAVVDATHVPYGLRDRAKVEDIR